MSGDASTALAHECRALSAVLHGLTPQDLTRPTNCPPWDLRELIVHTGDSIRVTGAAFAPAMPGEPRGSAADYYRRPERHSVAYRQRNVERTQQLARSALGETAVAPWFDEVYRSTIDRLSRQDPQQVVLIPGRGPMTWHDWTVTRVISVAAHGLDAAITLGRKPWTTPQALRVVNPVFVDLLGAAPPDALGWDEQTFLAAATGRRELTGPERDILMWYAESFPLLS